MKDKLLGSPIGNKIRFLKGMFTVLLPLVLLCTPAPAGLAAHSWRYFAVFAGVIAGLILETLPGATVGLIGVTLVAVLARFLLFSPEQLAVPGFSAENAGLSWALAGFADHTVWLIFAAFMFALGYEKTGLGKRIALLLVRSMGKRTLTLGYAIVCADVFLAPFTPSSTARSGGTIYPIIANLPPLYDSMPGDSTRRRLGAYVMWIGIASVSVTSSLFLTGLAPNLLAIQLIRKVGGIQLFWVQWFFSFAPVGLLLLSLLPLLTYWLYPPEIKEGKAVCYWADAELKQLGGISKKELILAVLVFMTLALWIVAVRWIDATTVALAAVCLMLVTGVLSEGDIMANKGAWRTFVWFATLIDMADGLNRVGFVKWSAETIAKHLGGFSPLVAMTGLLVAFFLAHYLFASITAHTTALLPVMVAVGAGIPGIPAPQFAMLLCLELGIMGVLTPFGCGSSPIYYGSGYISSAEFWKLGTIFGVIFLLVFLAIDIPWVFFLFRHPF